MDPQRVVTELNQARQYPLTIVSKSEFGISGAWMLSDSAGQRFVLKMEQDPCSERMASVAANVERLRVKGYPAPKHYPAQEFEGTTVWLQDWIRGVASDQIDHPLLESVVDMNALQTGEGVEGDSSWPDHIEQSLCEGISTYCGHEPLQGYNHESRRLLDRIREIGSSARQIVPAGRDLVHYDLHHRNVLRDQGAVTAVIDWDGCRPGHAVFDLVTFSMWLQGDDIEASLGDHSWMAAQLRDAEHPDIMSIYIGHMSIRIVCHTIRNYEPVVADRWIERCDTWLNDWV